MNFHPSCCSRWKNCSTQVTNLFTGRVQAKTGWPRLKALHKLTEWLTLGFLSSPRDLGSLCFHGISLCWLLNMMGKSFLYFVSFMSVLSIVQKIPLCTFKTCYYFSVTRSYGGVFLTAFVALFYVNTLFIISFDQITLILFLVPIAYLTKLKMSSRTFILK